MAEAKTRGYDTRIMRKIVSLRKRDLEDLAEEEAILSMYKTALGMTKVLVIIRPYPCFSHESLVRVGAS